ncbi:galactose-1-phosphate uridylyltransferase [Coprothermobacter proteolyticus]|uniref:galactose-1-phosphate uridylyltransferase n=1 Tax=Coprothermobacter proteolyticus TaxID=35786 RepID=UPI000D303279|nr:galactose-1-phosphate uridylyltransferase [Coprothermobacter proteolyticus]
MPEFRKDPLTGSWVIIAPERAQRPIDANHRTAQVEEFAEWSEECPFCSGNELMTPPEVLAYRSPGTGSNQRGWTLRVVRNKYPALSPDLELNTVTGNDLHRSMVGFGYHEVIIETPSHSRDFSFMALDEIEDVLWAWRDRLLSIRADKRIKYALVFKNYGHRAGASLVHPHSQIIATPMVPKRIEEEVQNMRNYYGEKGACLLCAMLNTEKSEKKRIVEQNQSFTAYCPYASMSAYQIMIVPNWHSSEFIELNPVQIKDLSKILWSVFRRLHSAVGGLVPYNLWLHNSPWWQEYDTSFFHWHIDLVPRLSELAGFELGSGLFINHTLPEEAAKTLASTNIE